MSEKIKNPQLPEERPHEALELSGCHIKINYIVPQNEHERGNCIDMMDFVKSVLLSANSAK